MPKLIDQASINRTLWRSCDTFRGTVSADTYKDFILTMLFIKYLSDVWQERYDHYRTKYRDAPEQIDLMMRRESFVLPMIEDLDDDGNPISYRAHFDALYTKRHQPHNGKRIDKVLRALEDANQATLSDTDRRIFQDIRFDTDKLGEEKHKNTILRHLLEDFAQKELDLTPSKVGNLDLIGNAYEYLIGQFAAHGGKKAGEFYTPPEVSDLLSKLLDPQPQDSICDPACGSGSLLLKCGRAIVDHHGSQSYRLYGQEAIGSTWSLAKMNMVLHGEHNHQIAWGDTLRSPKLLDDLGQLLQFDIVVANPPFSLKKWGHEDADKDKFGRFHRGLPPKNKGDYAFLLHMIATLKPTTGRMGVIVPHGVLFRGGQEGAIRTKLIQENLLDTVIGLPEKLFYGTGIPAAILLLKKHKSDDNILFIDASREYKAGKKQNRLTSENLAKIVSTYHARHNLDRYAYLATASDLQANDYSLHIPRYVDTFAQEEEIDLMAIRAERLELHKQLDTLEERMTMYLQELGFDHGRTTRGCYEKGSS